MPKKSANEYEEHHWKHKKGKGLGLLILGILILANAYFSIMNWALFIGWIAVSAGIIKIFMLMKL